MTHLAIASALIGAAGAVSCSGSVPRASATTVEAPNDPDASNTSSLIDVEMVGFRSDVGTALVGLYLASEGFPANGDKAHERIEVAIVGGEAKVSFNVGVTGKVAIAVLHDEDGDKKMKTGLFGRPKEGYGVSRNPVARFGPPSFDDSALTISIGQRITTLINLNY